MKQQTVMKQAEWLTNYFNQWWLAQKLGVTPATVSRRLRGDSEWRLNEAVIIEDLYKRTKVLEKEAQKLGL